FAVIFELEVLTHAASDIPPAEQHEVRVGVATRGMSAQNEHAAERIRSGRGERLGSQPVERATKLRDESRVAKEQSLRPSGVDLTRTVRDAERRALDERDDPFGADARAGAGRPGLRHRQKLLPDPTAK